MPKMYDDNTHSVIASLESLDPDRLIQNQASLSMFQSEESEPESDHSSTPWSPPAWRKGTSGWQQRHNLPPTGHRRSHSKSSSRHFSIEDEGDDTLMPSRIPLPASPEKETPSQTPAIAASTRTTRSPSVMRKHDRSRHNTSAPPEQSENCMTIFQINNLINLTECSYPFCS